MYKLWEKNNLDASLLVKPESQVDAQVCREGDGVPVPRRTQDLYQPPDGQPRKSPGVQVLARGQIWLENP